MKTDVFRNLANKSRKSEIRTCEKKFADKVAENELEAAGKLLSETISCYDKAAKVGTIHKNLANRKKSRLTHMLKNASSKA